VEPKPEIPHGIRYSLTLHDRGGNRVLGFDNAHGIRIRKPRHGIRPVVWDHIHVEKKLEPYDFESSRQLLVDFWQAVNEYRRNKG